MFFRYPEVVLMVAEAYMRLATPDNAKSPCTGKWPQNSKRCISCCFITVDPSAGAGRSLVDDPNCLLAERGRELYWESVRRTDLIRFGVFLTPWQYKPTDDPTIPGFPGS